jgi:colanic acid biosynthesis glycosyl transferase WcaI
MRIGVVGVNFFPERVGIGVYTYDMCRFFVEAGHAVSMIAGFPFYPELRRDPRHAGWWYRTERIDGIRVHRCPIHVPRRWGVGSRIAHELSFAASAVPRLLTVGADVCVVISPPFTAAVPATMVLHARGIPVAVHAQDLQPDAAAKLGMLRDGPMLRALYRAERNLYRRATLVSTLDEAMRATIIEKGVPEEKVVVFPNWVDMSLGSPPDGGSAFRAEHGFDGQFLIVYSGSMGVKQGLELILEVAGLAVGDPSVRFVLIGDGGAREGLEAGARARGLANVSFLPLQPLERFPDVVAASDLSLIPQRPEVRDLVVPSKVLRVMAGGSPIVAAAHPESGLARVLQQSGAGVVVPRTEAAVVWDVIRQLQANPERRRAMGERGRAYAALHFERRTILARYLKQLETITRA